MLICMPFYCLQSLCSRHCFRSTGQPPGSDPGHHSLYQLGGVERCGLFKGRIIHLGTVIRLVGNGTDDDKGNTVQVSTVGNGSTLHLGTVPLKFFDQAVLDFFAGNELISADYTPGMNVNVRIDLLTGAGSNLDKMLICKEFPASQLGNFPRLVTEMVASTSWCRASLEIRISPMSRAAFRDPATPVLMMAVT